MIFEIGKHRVRHGSVTDLDRIKALMAGENADIMYSDPPWGQGNIKYWATMNKKMTGEDVTPVALDEMLSAIFSIAQLHVYGFVVIEYGKRWANEVLAYAGEYGLAHLGSVEAVYSSKKLPLDIHLFTNAGLSVPDGYFKGVEGTTGYDCVRAAWGPLIAQIKKVKGEVLGLDPCCGMGYTAQACVDHGAAFRGNELNMKRLEKTIARLEKDAT